MKNLIIKLLLMWQLKELNKNGHCWEIKKHKSWGNAIHIFDWERRRIQGWNKDINVGDMLIIPMESGKDCVGIVTALKFERDPDDMFFGTVKEVGYLEDLLKFDYFNTIFTKMKNKKSRYKHGGNVYYMRKDFYSTEREFI